MTHHSGRLIKLTNQNLVKLLFREFVLNFYQTVTKLKTVKKCYESNLEKWNLPLWKTEILFRKMKYQYWIQELKLAHGKVIILPTNFQTICAESSILSTNIKYRTEIINPMIAPNNFARTRPKLEQLCQLKMERHFLPKRC